MIFVTVGTNEARFDRLLRMIAEVPFDEKLVVQHGHSTPIDDSRTESIDFLPFDAMGEMMRRARVVITHAGVGSIMVALANDKRPVVVPRRRSFGEAVDDHQFQLGRRFAEAKLVTLVEDATALEAALRRPKSPVTLAAGSSQLAVELRGYLSASIGLTPEPAHA
jgi:UDP-N-acetylglucosamine transferase subunit ALG13